ncbi:hypothetical protein LY78DRAFT_685123 [Colletotrichum sublineola]|nr:hypothetical protein LY78DRAFT_685123 [Colletotrichum sublineola]
MPTALRTRVLTTPSSAESFAAAQYRQEMSKAHVDQKSRARQVWRYYNHLLQTQPNSIDIKALNEVDPSQDCLKSLGWDIQDDQPLADEAEKWMQSWNKPGCFRTWIKNNLKRWRAKWDQDRDKTGGEAVAETAEEEEVREEQEDKEGEEEASGEKEDNDGDGGDDKQPVAEQAGATEEDNVLFQGSVGLGLSKSLSNLSISYLGGSEVSDSADTTKMPKPDLPKLGKNNNSIRPTREGTSGDEEEEEEEEEEEQQQQQQQVATDSSRHSERAFYHWYRWVYRPDRDRKRRQAEGK